MHALSRMGSKLEASVIHDVGNVHAVFGNTSHITDGIDNHVFSVVRQNVRFYLRIQKFQLAKICNINEKGTSVRQQMTKLVLFKNQ